MLYWKIRTVLVNAAVVFLAGLFLWFTFVGNEDGVGTGKGQTPVLVPIAAAAIIAVQIGRLVWFLNEKGDDADGKSVPWTHSG